MFLPGRGGWATVSVHRDVVSLINWHERDKGSAALLCAVTMVLADRVVDEEKRWRRLEMGQPQTGRWRSQVSERTDQWRSCYAPKRVTLNAPTPRLTISQESVRVRRLVAPCPKYGPALYQQFTIIKLAK